MKNFPPCLKADQKIQEICFSEVLAVSIDSDYYGEKSWWNPTWESFAGKYDFHVLSWMLFVRFSWNNDFLLVMG